MAHEVETMAYAGELPWHGLGFNISAGSTVEEWQGAAGLQWTVSKRPVLYAHGDAEAGKTFVPFKDRFVLARDTDGKPFSVVSNRYKPVQPKEILEFFRDLVDMHGMTIETAGSLRGGQRVWALAKTGDVHKVLGVDKVDGYLLLATSYDLTFSTLAQFTSVRVVCANTLAQSLGGQFSGRVSIPHFRGFDADSVKNEMGIGKAQWSAFTAALDTLAKMKLDVAKATEVMQSVFKVDPVVVSAENAVNIQHVSNVIDLFSGRAIGADVAGQTGWGLLNATTEYIDKHKRARNQDTRLNSSWFGDGAQYKQHTMDLLLAA